MTELDRTAIAKRIALARKLSGLDQREFADLLTVHWRTVQNWESPRRSAIPWDRLQEIAAVTGVTKDWLLHGEEGAAVGEGERILARLEELEGQVARMGSLMEEALQLLRAAPRPDARAEQARRRAG